MPCNSAKLKQITALMLLAWIGLTSSARAAAKFDCRYEFEELAEGPAFTALREFSRGREELTGHRVEVRRGKRVVSVGFLQKENDQRFMRLLARAIVAGEVDEIDAGRVVGPKVLPLLLSLSRLANEEHPLLVHGKIDIAAMEKNFFEQRAIAAQGGEKIGPFIMPVSQDRLRRAGQLFSEEEIAAYEQAKETLKIAKACKKRQKVKKLEKCKPLVFSMDARDPDGIRWEK